MSSLFVNGKLAGLIMAAGSAVLLLMLADLLYKGISPIMSNKQL